jgi:hypothetical protein
MEWLKLIGPLIGVALGFLLSQYGKYWSENRDDKKKLNVLAYYLLELRFQLNRRLTLEKEIVTGLTYLEEKIKGKLGKEFKLDSQQYTPLLESIVVRHTADESSMVYLETNIDSIIKEIAAFQPILAYELTGKYNIKERLKNTDSYLEEWKHILDQMPFDFKNWLKPRITENILSEIDKNL